MTPKRVLYVEGNVDGTIGGSYYSLLYLVAGLDRRRFEPVVVFARENELIPRFKASGAGVIIYSHPAPLQGDGAIMRSIARARNFFRGFIREPLRLALLLKKKKVSLVHLNNSVKNNHVWIIATIIARVPVLTHERGINERFKLRDRLLAGRLRAIICISAAVQSNLIARRFDRRRLVVIHNGLDPEVMKVTRSTSDIRRELNIPAHARLIGIVGNLKPWKGQVLVVRAMAELRDEFPEVVCVLIGEIPAGGEAYQQELLGAIADLGLEHRVVITGYRHDVANYINALEILIHASILPEPFGRVLLEGMALRRPLVASGDGAIPEIVVDNETGLIFEPGNAAALSGCLRQLLRDREQAVVFGEAGFDRLLKEFSIATNVRQTEALYDKILGGLRWGDQERMARKTETDSASRTSP